MIAVRRIVIAGSLSPEWGGALSFSSLYFIVAQRHESGTLEIAEDPCFLKPSSPESIGVEHTGWRMYRKKNWEWRTFKDDFSHWGYRRRSPGL